MPSFNPFTSVTGKNALTLFEIRLENDFIVFRGSETESSGQLLKGTVVLCLSAPLKIEDVHLRLTGTLHYAWTDSKVTPTGIARDKVAPSPEIFLNHKWQPFAGIGSEDASGSTRGITLGAGNYEWPFELLLPGNTCESVEGLHEASVTYKLKATVARGKLAYDLHAYKRLRIIRTLESSALEFLHSMSVENIWPNKIEYSIIIPQKAVVFGSSIPLETRFTPLLKGLDIGDITIKLVEVHEIHVRAHNGYPFKEHKKERQVSEWVIPMSREEYWHDMIEETGQEGWLMTTTLDLPRKLGKCVQDVNVHGIKVRHKLKLVVALKNPDGHTSELRATLPVTIFISPNMPLDEEGNLVNQAPQNVPVDEARGAAPPGYGEHVLDALYEDLPLSGMQTPGVQSGMNTPFYGHSRAGSTENLASMMESTTITPAALSSRLQSMSLDPSHRNNSWNSLGHGSGGSLTPHGIHDHHPTSQPASAPLSRQHSDEHGSPPGSHTPEHLEGPTLAELSKVPSYQTAVKTPVKPLTVSSQAGALPDYQTVMSAPSSPTLPHATHSVPGMTLAVALPEPVTSISGFDDQGLNMARPRPTMGRRRQTSHDVYTHNGHSVGDDDRRRLHLMQARERVV
ncbi:hypothetical protein DL546_008929 [Coniochaeta pulveracea]|uniref:Arrestin C-terminal-like domain-containing protein n=1 Tax=Coniochaeta pulveracea TaxID=177199 RepID=A0A420YLB7_9PEZI|nr:hypothetical protein DL546_008929 [Coniochaeta pulveracea]